MGGRDQRRGRSATDERDRSRKATAVDTAVRRAGPGLVDAAVPTASFVMCSETADRCWGTPVEHDEEAAGRAAWDGSARGDGPVVHRRPPTTRAHSGAGYSLARPSGRGRPAVGPGRVSRARAR
ncbi:DUF6357 family protein [Streptomyces sp. NPDC006270]|uniref:DUF6357 family protein n=1 Tax=Streptomyces sp. NPDC006270 TaxID=3364741 RepID=UPI0036B0B9CA